MAEHSIRDIGLKLGKRAAIRGDPTTGGIIPRGKIALAVFFLGDHEGYFFECCHVNILKARHGAAKEESRRRKK
jgi:hypothetical protein